jgi:fructosamine-3-kinase
MKFTDGYWLMRPGCTARYATEVADVRADDHRMTLYAPVQHVSRRGQTLNSPLLTVECWSPAEGVIGVRTTHHAGSARRGPEFALPGSEADAGKVRRDGTVRELVSGELTLRVDTERPWRLEFTADKVADRLRPSTGTALRRELGAITARLHTLAPEDGQFGYPAGESGLSAPDWRTAFTAMVDALLADADRWQSPLGVSPAGIRTLVAEGSYALDEVTEPRLVHFDLWPGNIFVDLGGDGRQARITGLIDHERAFWGDPAAELVSLAFCGDTDPDSDLVAGYIEAGGSLDFSPALRHRLALYQLYLGLLLVVECGPRGYGPDHLSFCRGTLADALTRLQRLGQPPARRGSATSPNPPVSQR